MAADNETFSGAPDNRRLASAIVMSDGNVAMTSPDGEPVLIGASNLQEAVNSGYTVQDPEERAARLEREKYSESTLMQAGAVGAGVARGVSFGTSDVLAAQLGHRELFQKMREYNPGLSTAGEIGGAIGGVVLGGPGSLLARGGMAATKGIGSSVGRYAAREALEGAVYGVGASVSDVALSPKNMSKQEMAEHLVMGAGMGAIVGGAFGGAFGAAAGVSSRWAKNRVLGLGKESADATPPPEASLAGQAVREGNEDAAAKLSGEIRGEIGPLINDPAAIEIRNRNTESLTEGIVAAANKKRVAGELVEELPQSEVLKQALDDLPDLDINPGMVRWHLERTKSKSNLFELEAQQAQAPKPLRESMEQLDNSLAKEIQDKTQKVIDDFAPGSRRSTIDSGEEAIELIHKSYKQEAADTGELYKRLDAAENRIPKKNHIPDLQIKVAGQDGLEKIQPHMIFDEKTSVLKLGKYDAASGITKTEWNLISSTFERMSDTKKGVSFKDIMNLRETLRRDVLEKTGTRASREVQALRKAMFEHAINLVDLYVPDVSLREAATRWAKNKQFIEGIEDVLGKKFEADSIRRAVKPEEFLNSIFGDKNSITAAQKLIIERFGAEKWRQLAADYAHNLFEKTRDGVTGRYQAGAITRILKDRGQMLELVLSPSDVKRLRALNIVDRVAARAASANPSGSGRTAWAYLAKSGKSLFRADIPGVVEGVGGMMADFAKAKNALRNIENILRNGAEAKKVSDGNIKRIKKNVSDFFKNHGVKKSLGPAKAGAQAFGASLWGRQHQEQIEQLAEIAVDPNIVVERAREKLKGLEEIDPELAAEVEADIVRSVSFLHSVAPKKFSETMMADKAEFQPSDAEVAKFQRYAAAVENPLHVMQEFADGQLTKESVEAVKATKPLAYEYMVRTTLEQLVGKDLSYSQKMQLSVLMGEPTTSALRPDFIRMLQQGFGDPNESDSQMQQGGASGGAVRPTQGGLAKLDRSKQNETSFQKAINRA